MLETRAVRLLNTGSGMPGCAISSKERNLLKHLRAL